MKKKIISHLKGDVKSFKHEAAEDKELIKELSGKKAMKNKKEVKAGKKAGAALKKEVKAGKKEAKVSKVMHEFKEKKLHSGSKKGPVVTNDKQALAIALSEGRKAASGGKSIKMKKKK